MAKYTDDDRKFSEILGINLDKATTEERVEILEDAFAELVEEVMSNG